MGNIGSKKDNNKNNIYIYIFQQTLAEKATHLTLFNMTTNFPKLKYNISSTKDHTSPSLTIRTHV